MKGIQPPQNFMIRLYNMIRIQMTRSVCLDELHYLIRGQNKRNISVSMGDALETNGSRGKWKFDEVLVSWAHGFLLSPNIFQSNHLLAISLDYIHIAKAPDLADFKTSLI